MTMQFDPPLTPPHPPPRPGAPKALTATARKLAVLLYHLVTTGEEYQEPDLKHYDKRVRKNKIIRLQRQAKERPCSARTSRLTNVAINNLMIIANNVVT